MHLATILWAIRRVLGGVTGVALMIVAVYWIPVSFIQRRWPQAFGFFLLGFVGLWVLQFSRGPSDSVRPSATPWLSIERSRTSGTHHSKDIGNTGRE